MFFVADYCNTRVFSTDCHTKDGKYVNMLVEGMGGSNFRIKENILANFDEHWSSIWLQGGKMTNLFLSITKIYADIDAHFE